MGYLPGFCPERTNQGHDSGDTYSTIGFLQKPVIVFGQSGYHDSRIEGVVLVPNPCNSCLGYQKSPFQRVLVVPILAKALSFC